jgi:hypothetical protein
MKLLQINRKMIKEFQIKNLPINDLFKDNQEPIYILNLNYNYKQLIKKYGFDYEIWEESEGFMIGGAIEINEYTYLLKAALNHSTKKSLVDVYVLTDTNNIKHATEKLLKSLGLNNNEIIDNKNSPYQKKL